MTTDLVGLLKEALPFIDTHPDLHRPGGDELSERIAAALNSHSDELRALAGAEVGGDTARLDYIERTFSGITNRERYLPVQMIWGKGAMGRTLREACDKYMKRDAERTPPPGSGRGGVNNSTNDEER
jgi:hypothetical protein